MSSSEYGQNANRSKIDKQVKRIEKEVHMIDQLTRPWSHCTITRQLVYIMFSLQNWDYIMWNDVTFLTSK